MRAPPALFSAPGSHGPTKWSQHPSEFYRSLSKQFTSVKRFKPAASRQESRELYFVALGRRPRPA